MRKKSLSTYAIRTATGLCVLIAVAGLSGYRLSGPFSDALRAPLEGPRATILPGSIQAGAQFDVVAESPGKVLASIAVAGSRVAPGDPLFRLENAEITGQAENAEKRMNIAKARLDEAASGPRNATNKYERERLAGAVRDCAAAKERLDAYHLSESEHAVERARERVAELRNLVRDGLATSSELENAQAEERNASHTLRDAEEHLSRLKQELDQAESQVRMVQTLSSGTHGDRSAAQLQFEEARFAWTTIAERAGHLTVAAPAAGTVVGIAVHTGDWVSAGTVLARVADLSKLMLSVPVSARIARRVTPGETVRLSLPTDPPRRLSAQVDSVTALPDPVQHAYLVKVIVPNPDPKTVLVGLEAAVEFGHGGRP